MSATTSNTAPHNLVAEKSVLGAVLLDEQHLHALLVDEQLRPEHFYLREHAAVFEAMLQLYDSDRKIDHLTVAEQLRDNNRLDELGGPDVVEELVAWVPATGHARDYGRIVREQSQMRALLDATREIQSDVVNRAGSPRELVEAAERAMLEVAHDERQKAIRSIAEVLHEETDRLHHRSNQKSPLTGTPSGFRDIDDITGGFQPGNLIVLAARPSMGKSALVANIAENAALAGYPVALYSLEMSESELAQRFVASQAKVPGEDLRRGKVAESRWPKILEASGKLSKAPLYIDDSSDTGALEVRAKSRRLHHQLEQYDGLGLIIIDYLQLMRHEGRIESRVEQVGQISRGLKSLARELHVPVIALSQLSRNVEQRAGDKKPILSDLRECVTGDTLVVLADGSRAPIAELVGSQPRVLAVNERHRIVSAQSDAVWCVGRKPVLKVQLASGRTFRGTRKHRVLSGHGWQELGRLEVGDRFALARHIPEPVQPERWPREVGVAMATGGVTTQAMAAQRGTLRLAAESDLFWDRIVAIDEDGEEEVYDLTVPGPACWLADGLVTHNSGQIEQDADLVMFIYREEYYNRESTRPGEADIIIAKHRNGPVGEITLTFQSQFPKFMNYAPPQFGP